MRQLLLLLLMMSFLNSLSSCRSMNLGMKYKGEQCAPTFVYVDETMKLIDADESFCSVREYEFNYYRVGPVVGTDKKMPLSYCDRCVGFKNYTDVATFWEKVRREIVDSSSK